MYLCNLKQKQLQHFNRVSSSVYEIIQVVLYSRPAPSSLIVGIPRDPRSEIQKHYTA